MRFIFSLVANITYTLFCCCIQFIILHLYHIICFPLLHMLSSSIVVFTLFSRWWQTSPTLFFAVAFYSLFYICIISYVFHCFTCSALPSWFSRWVGLCCAGLQNVISTFYSKILLIMSENHPRRQKKYSPRPGHVWPGCFSCSDRSKRRTSLQTPCRAGCMRTPL